MARPKKQTIDYFPHSCTHGKTMFIIEQKYGNDGYAFWFKLLELLGDTAGHYIDLNDEATQEFLQAKTRISWDLCHEILDLLAKLDAIDAELWEHKIVWCQNFVDGISDVYKNRRTEIPSRPSFYIEKPHDADISTGENPKSKVKKSKGKESKEKESKEKEDISLQIKNLRSRYSEEQLKIIDEYFDILRWTRKNGKIADSVVLKIYQEWEKYPIPKVIYALKIYIDNPKYHDKRENYCYGIMRNATAEEIAKGGMNNGQSRGNNRQNTDPYAGIGLTYEDLQQL